MEPKQLKNIIEAALLAADQPLTPDQLLRLFEDNKEIPTRDEIRKVLAELQTDCEGRGYELKKVASGYRYQTRVDVQPWERHLSGAWYRGVVVKLVERLHLDHR